MKLRKCPRCGEQRWQQTLLPCFQSMVTIVMTVINISFLLTMLIHFQAKVTSFISFYFVVSSPLCSNSPLKAELVPKTATKQQQQQKKGMQKGQFCPRQFFFQYSPVHNLRAKLLVRRRVSKTFIRCLR